MDAGIGVNQYSFGSKALGTVAGDSIAVVEVAMLGRIEFDLAPALKPRDDATIGRDGFDQC